MSNDFVITNRRELQPLPAPRVPIIVRPAAICDLAFIDSLQSMHRHQVGWFPKKQLEGKIEAGNVVVAEENRTPIGYCIAQDTYAGRDDLGIIYQLNVLPLRHRHLVGAALVKATFEKAAYGCKLFCCWCAQDIQANWFWEALGFVPLAFRAGSAGKERVHIFWQKRVREGDTSTPWWFPAQTKNGAIRQDRIVLPIPQGTHWRDVKPIVLPGMKQAEAMPLTLPGGAPVKGRPEQPRISAREKALLLRSQSQHLKGVPMGKKAVITGGGIKYIERKDYVPELDAPDAFDPKPKKISAPREKTDPKLIAAARELRDRFLEQVNHAPLAIEAKYEVSRALEAPSAPPIRVPAQIAA